MRKKIATKELRALLQKGVSIREIAKRNNMNPQSLWKRCKRNGLKSLYTPFAQVDIEEVKKLYKEGLSVKVIGERLGVCGKTIWKRLKKEDVVLRSSGKGVRSLSPFLREDFFETIDDETKAYWLGMLFADGSVHVGEKQSWVNFVLKESDGYHVRLLKKTLKSCVRLYVSKKDGSVGLTVSSKKMCADLIAKGCVSGKSRKQITVVGVPEEQEVHFWRGVFDGDGSIAFSGRKRETLQFRLCSSSKKLLAQFVCWVESKCGVILPKNSLLQTGTNVWVVQVYAKNAEEVLRTFYENSSVWLQRKRTLFELYERKSVVRAKRTTQTTIVIEESVLDEVKGFVMKNHYANNFPAVTKCVLVAKEKGDIIAVVTLGYGAYPLHTVKKLFATVALQNYYEIGRMCFAEHLEKGFGSRMLSAVRTWIKKNRPEIKVLYTWSDGFRGKPGYVYQAAGFFYGGFIWTDRYVNDEGEVVHPKATKALCREEEKSVGKKVFWLSEAMQRKNGLKRYKGKQFRYVAFLCGKHEKKVLLRDSLFSWTCVYPKEDDLVWKVQRNGVFVDCTSPCK